MAEKKCVMVGCEEVFQTKGARKFCELHARQKKAPGKPKVVPAEDEGMAYPINLTERQMDKFWATLTLTEKGQAIQAILDWQELA